ncbi:hypothetical protein MtrunA17_Chr3g0098871 [Medicago truncatula]|uniref:Transmembrane protein n=1 Tax=Medicago truncatula TaxID=3880 RepID=A0A396IRU3_MEDTR|nr:hypothetical protein MtrunA17_Chr3g0098871 [Medicago truncatula]
MHDIFKNVNIVACSNMLDCVIVEFNCLYVLFCAKLHYFDVVIELTILCYIYLWICLEFN